MTPSFWLPLLHGMLLFWGLVLPALASASVDLDQNWQYRWGDSPFQGDQPLWIQEDKPADWQSIDFPSNPPDRNGQTNVWYRTLLPEMNWRDPVLYIYSVDLITQVYLDGELIYQYGRFDTKGRGTFEGWPWHMITLPQDAGGKPIYFRVFSSYMDIGLWGEVKLMERMDLYQQIWQRSLENLMITGLSLLTALVSMVFAIYRAQRLIFAPLALFALAAGGLALSNTQAKQLLVHQPLMWDYVEAGSYYLLPVALVLLLHRGFRLIGRKPGRALEFVFTGYLLGALGLSLLGVVNLSDTYPVFDFIFALLVPSVLILAMLKRGLGVDQQVILSASTVLTLLLLADLAVAHGWVDWSQVPVGWGTLAFSLALVILAARHYLKTQNDLAELNTSLETRVRLRTQELKEIANHEAKRAEALAYAQQRSDQFSKAIASLEQQGEVRDAVTFLIRLLPELMDTLPGVVFIAEEDGFRKASCWMLPQGLVFADRLTSENTPPPEHWKKYCLQYETPEGGTRLVALLWMDISYLQSSFIDLEPLALEVLTDRAVDRINLALSKTALQSALSRFSYEDGLTALKNRRYLDEKLPELVAHAHQSGIPLTLIICDIDHFKQFNDRSGHAAGDQVLRQLALQLKQVFRSSDLVCRFGGEEFVIVMPTASLAQGVQLANELSRQVREQDFWFEHENLGQITLSAGVSTLDQDIRTTDQLMRGADRALYQAKNTGRDRVVVYQASDDAISSP